MGKQSKNPRKKAHGERHEARVAAQSSSSPPTCVAESELKAFSETLALPGKAEELRQDSFLRCAAEPGGFLKMQFALSIARNDYNSVSWLVRSKKVDVDMSSNMWWAPEIVEALSAGDSDSMTFLHMISLDQKRGDRSPMIRLLCKLGADINRRDSGGRTPAFLAAGSNNAQMLATLHAAGADLNITDALQNEPEKWMTIVHAATQNNSIDTLRWLLSAGGQNANCVNGEGQKATHVAIERDCLESLEVLHEYGADIPKGLVTYACLFGRHRIIKWLKERDLCTLDTATMRMASRAGRTMIEGHKEAMEREGGGKSSVHVDNLKRASAKYGLESCVESWEESGILDSQGKRDILTDESKHDRLSHWVEKHSGCSWCGNKEARRHCQRCHAPCVVYCNKDCFASHWKAGHKALCDALTSRDASAWVATLSVTELIDQLMLQSMPIMNDESSLERFARVVPFIEEYTASANLSDTQRKEGLKAHSDLIPEEYVVRMRAMASTWPPWERGGSG